MADRPAPLARRPAILIFIGCCLLYIALSRGVFLYGDDVLMYQVTDALVTRGTVAVTSPTANDERAQSSGSAIAFTAASIPGRDGRTYAKYGIGQSLVALPTYVLSDRVLTRLLSLRESHDPFGNHLTGTRIYGTALVNALLGGATVTLAYLLAEAAGYARRTALVVAGLLGLASLLPHYAAGFLSEPLAALCLSACVYGLLRAARAESASRLPWPWLALSGFAAGLALATRPALAVALVAPGLWLLWLAWDRWRQTRWIALLACLAWGVPVSGWLAIVVAYNWARFGSATATGYGDEARAFTTPLLTGLSGLLLSPGRGLLWYVPPILLAILGSIWFGQRQPVLLLVVAGISAPVLVLHATYYAWHGGGVWGPRFLVPLLPLLLLPAASVVERAWHSPAIAAGVVGVATWGLLVTALGFLVPFDRYVARYAGAEDRLHAALWHVGDAPLVVHLRDVLAGSITVDVAAVRYASLPLALLTVVVGVSGLLCLAWATRVVLPETLTPE
jgi:hypothetical protein